MSCVFFYINVSAVFFIVYVDVNSRVIHKWFEDGIQYMVFHVVSKNINLFPIDVNRMKKQMNRKRYDR